MILVVTEKNDAAQQIARLLSESGKPEADKVYNTPVYRFRRGGEDHVAIGLRGQILTRKRVGTEKLQKGSTFLQTFQMVLSVLLTRLSASLLWQTALTLRVGKSPACLI